MTDIANRIRVERWLTPADIHERYGVLNGAIYGIASHGRWPGAFKPSNRSPDVKGLYLAGGAAHPGAGMPMVMMSGWIAADALDRDGVTSHPAAVKFASRAPLAATGLRSEFVPPVVANRSPLFVRIFRQHVKRFYLARLPRGQALTQRQTGPAP